MMAMSNETELTVVSNLTADRQKTYEHGRSISEDDEAYLLKILNTFERNMK
jgi:hypothetical protein